MRQLLSEVKPRGTVVEEKNVEEIVEEVLEVAEDEPKAEEVEEESKEEVLDTSFAADVKDEETFKDKKPKKRGRRANRDVVTD